MDGSLTHLLLTVRRYHVRDGWRTMNGETDWIPNNFNGIIGYLNSIKRVPYGNITLLLKKP